MSTSQDFEIAAMTAAEAGRDDLAAAFSQSAKDALAWTESAPESPATFLARKYHEKMQECYTLKVALRSADVALDAYQGMIEAYRARDAAKEID